MSNLKIGGIAFMRIKGAEGEGVNDTVTIGRGRASYQMSLVDYLVQKYPNNFEKLNGGRTLKMIRTKDVENLGLQELLKAVTQTVERFDGGEYPGVVWQLN